MKGSKIVRWIVAVGIGLRIILWLFQSAPEGDDGMRYLSESINIVRHGVFSADMSDTPLPSAHDMPFWPAIMALIYWLTDSIVVTQYVAGAVNLLLMTASALLLASLLRHEPFAFSDVQRAVSIGILLFMPESVIYSMFHMPDQLAVFCIISALWFYFRASVLGIRYFFGVFLMLLLAIYAKPICLPLAGALIFAIPCLNIKKWRRGIMVSVVGFLIIGIGLCPWVWRNREAFGTAGLTSISGTNLYRCNWGGLVGQLPKVEQDIIKREMGEFESRIAGFDNMKKSQLQGEYAKRQILAHLPDYVLYTIKRHPRLYAGTGTVALLRYLGWDRVCDALDAMWGSNNARGFTPKHDTPYTVWEKLLGGSLQVGSWLVAVCGYVLVLFGIVNGLKLTHGASLPCKGKVVVVLCPILSLILLAAVIGPITATRYRFIMIPFFAILSGYACIAGGLSLSSIICAIRRRISK